ncbi:MAG: c-type cytochrome, partial [Nitrospirales bacterium]
MKKGWPRLIIGIGLAGMTTWALAASIEQPVLYGLGRAATPEDIRAWNFDVPPSGEGLPPGQGTVQDGAAIFAKKCAGCHGPTGK